MQVSSQGRSNSAAMRATARAVGVLILVGYVAYGPAQAMVTSMLEGTDALVAADSTLLGIAAISMLVNSAAVIGIGVLMFTVARPYGEGVALSYLATRVFEAILLAVGVVFVLLQVPIAREAAAGGSSVQALSGVALEGTLFAYQVAMIGLGVGSIPLWLLAYRTRLVPRALAALGILGYAVFAIGAALEIVGIPVGLMLSIPGGLFEVAVAIWLIARGFSTSSVAPVVTRADSMAVAS